MSERREGRTAVGLGEVAQWAAECAAQRSGPRQGQWRLLRRRRRGQPRRAVDARSVPKLFYRCGSILRRREEQRGRQRAAGGRNSGAPKGGWRSLCLPVTSSNSGQWPRRWAKRAGCKCRVREANPFRPFRPFPSAVRPSKGAAQARKGKQQSKREKDKTDAAPSAPFVSTYLLSARCCYYQFVFRFRPPCVARPLRFPEFPAFRCARWPTTVPADRVDCRVSRVEPFDCTARRSTRAHALCSSLSFATSQHTDTHTQR